MKRRPGMRVRAGTASQGPPAPSHRRPPAAIARRLARFAARNGLAIAVALAALHLLLALLTFLPQPHTGGDNAAYISLGRSLLERHAYLSLYDPAAPPHTQYPPVFPGLLALAMLAGLEPWVQLKILMALLSAAAVAFTFLWLRRRRRPVLALGVAALVALSPGVLEQAHWILSDVPFWLFTMLALWGFERLRPPQRGRFAVAAAATILAYFTRTAGLPLLVAAAAWLALRRRWKPLAALAAVALPLALAWWLRARAQGGIDYVSQFWFVNPYSPELGRIGVADLFDRMLENGSKYVRLHLPILLTGAAGGVGIALALPVTGLSLTGWALRMRRPALAELFLPLYLGLLLVWPAVWSGERFLLPVLPLILYYAGDALVRVASRVRAGAGFAAGLVAFAVAGLGPLPQTALAVSFGGRCTFEYRAGDRYPCMAPAWRDLFDIGEWARETLPQGAVVLSRKPRLFYVVSGHAGRNYPMSPEPAELIRTAQEAGARYIVFDHLDRLSQVYLAPAVLGRIQAFCAMHTATDGTVVLGIVPDADTMPDSPPAAAPQTSVPSCGDEYFGGPR